jgi:hypothetical protein
MMGARARGKLNKNGLVKQPGNMRGLTAPAMGGLAAASRDKGKMRRPVGFARGSEGEPVGGLDYTELRRRTRAPGSGESLLYDDPELLLEMENRRNKFHADVADAALRRGVSANPRGIGVSDNPQPIGGEEAAILAALSGEDMGGLASAPTEIGGGLAPDNVKQQSHASTTPQAKAEAMTESDALAQLRAAVLRAQARREQPQGNVNIPLLMAAGAMAAPTRTGSFFEALGGAMTAGGNALSGQRKTDEEQIRSSEDMNIGLLKAEVARQDALRKRQLDEAYRYAELDTRMKAAQARSSMGGAGGGVVMAQINQRAADLMEMNPGKYTPAQARDLAFKERNGALKAQYNAIYKARGQNAANAFAIENDLMDAVTAPGLEEVYGDSTGSGAAATVDPLAKYNSMPGVTVTRE